jgi:predicted nucleic acid-binding protein
LSKKEFSAAKERNTTLWQSYTEITEYSLVKKRSYRLLETHRLRAADALHLAAALVGFEEQTIGVEFVTFDRNLGDAAEKEGFIVTGPEQLKT